MFIKAVSFLGKPYIPSFSPPRFGSVYSAINHDNVDTYNRAAETDPAAHSLRRSLTRIFREYNIPLFIAKLVGADDADIHILGCSDGSEVYSYAIAIKEMRELLKSSADNVRIVGLDNNPALIALAKTGHIICADLEKDEANTKNGHPLAGEGWERYLEQKQSAPKEFERILKRYPDAGLEQLLEDPIADIRIGQGLEWYRVKRQGFPKIRFEPGDMQDYVRQPRSAKVQVFVVANTLRYTFYEEGPETFFDVLKEIRQKNAGKEVFLVTGEAEQKMFREWVEHEDPYSPLNPFTLIQTAGFSPIELQTQSTGRPVPLWKTRIWAARP